MGRAQYLGSPNMYARCSNSVDTRQASSTYSNPLRAALGRRPQCSGKRPAAFSYDDP